MQAWRWEEPKQGVWFSLSEKGWETGVGQAGGRAPTRGAWLGPGNRVFYRETPSLLLTGRKGGASPWSPLLGGGRFLLLEAVAPPRPGRVETETFPGFLGR